MKNLLKFLLLLQSLLIICATPAAQAFRKDRRDAERGRPSAGQQLDRLRHVMLPLLQASDHRIAVDDVRLTIVDEAAINAASAGNGQFYVTTGLLR